MSIRYFSIAVANLGRASYGLRCSGGARISRRWVLSRSFSGHVQGGQRESKHSPATVVILRQDPPAVCLNDRARDRQAHTQSVRFGGEKRIEDMHQLVGGDAVAVIAHCDLYELRTVELRGHSDSRILPAYFVESIHSVEDEI